MHMRVPLRLVTLLMALALTMAVAVPAQAQASKRHDYEYAMALANKKRYYDLAKAEFQRLIDGGGELASKGEFGMTKILVIQARREQEPAKKADQYQNALSKMGALVKGNDALVFGLFDLGELYIEYAKFQLKRIEKEGDKAAELTDSARGAYDEAIKAFEIVTEKFADAESEEDKVTYRRSQYYVIECKFEKAITYPVGDKTRNGILKSLQEKIEAFCWDNEDYIEAYYAYTILGQAQANLVEKKHPRLSDLEDAFAAFQAALNIPIAPMTEFCRTLAYSRFMAECNRFKFSDKTLELAKQMRKEYPGIEDMRFGQFAVIEEAKAYWDKRETGTALAVIGKIAQKRTAAGSAAQLLLGKWQAVTGGKQSAEEAFLVAEGFRREREWWKALRGYQAAIEALIESDKQADKEKFLIKSWEWSAFCFQRLSLAYEAHHALMEATRAAQKLGNTAKAAENAYYAFRAIKRRANISKLDGDRAIAKQARDFFLDNFKNSPYTPGIQLEQARDLEDQDKFAQAISAYQAIPKTTEFYEEALSRIGICYYRQMKKQAEGQDELPSSARDSGRKALAAIDEYKAFIAKNKTNNEASQQRRAELLGRVIYYQGSVSDKLGDSKKVLEIFKDFERTHESAGTELVGAAILLRIKAFVDLSNAAAEAGNKEEQLKLLREAESEMLAMKRSAGNSRYMAFGNQRVGFAWIAVADSMKGDTEGAKRFKRRAMNFLVPWALQARNLKYDHLKFVALICYVFGPQEGDAEFVQHATNLLDLAVRRFPDDVEKDKDVNMKALLAECYFKTEQWAKALSLLRAEYEANPRSLLALRSLGRCYYELGRKEGHTARGYKEFIVNSQREDTALLKAATSDPDADTRRSLGKDCVRRASQLYEFIYETANKGRKDFTDDDHKAFQTQLMAKAEAERMADFKKLINQFYFLKLKQIEGMDAKALQMNASVFAMDRALYYYRTVAAKVRRLENHWWGAKYHVLACYYVKGKALHEGAEEPSSKAYRRGSDLLKHAERLYKNYRQLYPSMGGPQHKDNFEKLNTLIKEQLGR